MATRSPSSTPSATSPGLPTAEKPKGNKRMCGKSPPPAAPLEAVLWQRLDGSIHPHTHQAGHVLSEEAFRIPPSSCKALWLCTGAPQPNKLTASLLSPKIWDKTWHPHAACIHTYFYCRFNGKGFFLTHGKFKIRS